MQQLRNKHGVTGQQLAEDSGVSYELIVKLEGATSGGSVETWAALADALGEPLPSMFEDPLSHAPTSSTGAREAARIYGSNRGKRSASAVQLDDLVRLAGQLDKKTVEALLHLVRRAQRR